MATSSACAGSCHRDEESAQCFDDDRNLCCRLLGCGRPVYRDAHGPKEFCGRTHALHFLENRLQQAELTVCDFRDCKFPQARKADGGFHLFCSWRHAKKHASLKASITLSVSIPSLGPQQQDLVPNGISVSSEPQDSEPCESEFEATLSLSASDHDQARGIHNLSCGLEQLPVEESHPPELGVTEMDLGPDLIHNQQLEATVSWNSSLPRQLEQQQQLEQQREQLWNQILAAWPNEEGFREVQLETIQIRHDEGVDTTHPWGLMPAHKEAGPILYFHLRKGKSTTRVSRVTSDGLTWRQSGSPKPDCNKDLGVTKRTFAYQAMSGKKFKDLPLVRIFTPPDHECATRSGLGDQELPMEASKGSKKRKSRDVKYRYKMTEYSADSAEDHEFHPVIYALRQKLSETAFPNWPRRDVAISPSGPATDELYMAKSKVARTQVHATLESANECAMACGELQVRDLPDQPEGRGGGLVLTSDIDAGSISVVQERMQDLQSEEPQSASRHVVAMDDDDGHHGRAQCTGRTPQEETADACDWFHYLFADAQTSEGVAPLLLDSDDAIATLQPSGVQTFTCLEQ